MSYFTESEIEVLLELDHQSSNGESWTLWTPDFWWPDKKDGQLQVTRRALGRLEKEGYVRISQTGGRAPVLNLTRAGVAAVHWIEVNLLEEEEATSDEAQESEAMEEQETEAEEESGEEFVDEAA